MPDEPHFKGLQSMYIGAPINRIIPSRLTVREGAAEVVMEVSEDYWHAAGALHGSLYFKALDDAAFFAANSIESESLVLTARFEVELLAPVTSSSLRAVGQLDRRDGKKIEASSVLHVANQVVARGRGLFVVSSLALTDMPGYCHETGNSRQPMNRMPDKLRNRE